MNFHVLKERTCGSKIRMEVLEYVNELEMGRGESAEKKKQS